LAVHPDSQDVLFNWEDYAKSVFEDEVNGNSVKKDEDNDNGSDTPTDSGSGVKIFKIDLSYDADGFPLLPPINETNMPKFPLLKKYIRAYLTAHYRKA
jgi:hypothetical protein